MHAVRVAPVVAVVLGLLVMSGAAGCDAISGHHSAAPVASQLSTSAAVVSRPAGHASPAVKGKSSGGVKNLTATAAVQSALLQAYVAMKHIPASDVADSQPGSVYYGYDKATKTYWAMARYDPSRKAPQAVEVSFQDGGSIGFFKRVGAGPWQASLGGVPVICEELRFFPKAALAAWSLPTTHPASMC
jgi:hypothetical protein